jgi:hypothetical protein
MASTYAGCFRERDSIPKRIKDEESGNYLTGEELELLGAASETTELDRSLKCTIPSEMPTDELDKKDEVSLLGS